MNVAHRIAARTETISSLVLTLVLAAVLAADTAATAARHANWPFELAVGAVVGALAVFRGRNRLLACAAVRVAAPLPAALVAATGAVVLVAGRFSLRGEYIVALSFLGVLARGFALTVGAWMRLLDIRRRLVVDTARRGERLELARGLHDVVAHHVAGIVVQAQAARIVAAKRPADLDDTLAGIESAGGNALAAMRRVVGLLRDPGDTGGVTPGPERLSDLVSRFAERGPAVRLRLPDSGLPPWPPEMTATVYRIVQEALTNVILHAPDAASVAVTVEETSAGVTVEVTDDAPGGHEGGHGGGHGLTGMRERAEALGGTLRAGPGPDHGWTVAAALPLPAGRNA